MQDLDTLKYFTTQPIFYVWKGAKERQGGQGASRGVKGG